MSTDLKGVKLHFAETMSGFVAAEETTFEDGYKAGEHAGLRVTLHVNVDISDLAEFLASSQHVGQLTGYVDCPSLGGKATVQDGRFHLLPPTGDLNRRTMNYLVHCVRPDGQRYTLIGEKEVQNRHVLDMWTDTTTLFTNIFDDFVEPEQRPTARVLATGILHLGVSDLIALMKVFRATTPEGQRSIEGEAAFMEFFAGSLWQLYGPSLPPAPSQPQRPYPRFTTEGVKGADISVHPFSSGDGLGLTLTRFQRAKSDDVVLLIHGLTSSTDMFIMPEHVNIVQYLLDNGYGDVWSLDYRGSCRFPYNLQRSRYTLDDIALFDHPAALATLRQKIGPGRRIHVIAHCVGALSFSMSLFSGAVTDIASLVVNSVSLTPNVPTWSKFKLAVGPFACDYLAGIEYFNPGWRREPGWSVGKLLAYGVDLFHHECSSPECHMLSFMWGTGQPALFEHENLAEATHARLGDLFGGVGVHYYRHIHKMVSANNTAVKYDTDNPRYAALPYNYLDKAASITTPMLLIQGQENRVFADSNVIAHQRLEQLAPGRHQIHVFPAYGHQDIFMGKNVHQDIFPRLLAFLNSQRGQ